MKGFVVALAVVFAVGAACGDDGPKLSVEELQDPATCMTCHPKHFQQWSGSMHAYASEDPVFVAMNNRGQRETGGKLGDFCVRCHAPMAVELGLTDGTNFDPLALPPIAKGITCYFCHNVDKVEGTHNNGLVLAMDQTMRGGLQNAVDNPAHHSAYDELMDSDRNESEMCGGCHDIVVPEDINGVPGGVAVERTFLEWQTTFFATDKSPGIHLTCGGCHMPSSTEVIADAPGLAVKSRPFGFHEHMWPAVDQALTPFPETEAQAARIHEDLKGAIAIVGTTPLGSTAPLGGICVTPEDGGQITVRIDSFNVGHAFPSGAAQDRRAWVELRAFDASNNVIFESGIVPDGMDPEQIDDPNLFGMWDQTFKADDTPAHFFWEVARSDPSWLLRPPVTNDPTDPRVDHSRTEDFPIVGLQNMVDRIEARVLMRALPFELIDLLVASGDLAPEIRARLPTLELEGTKRVWRRSTIDNATGCCSRFDQCRP
jgi:nitrate/TMAO reductase-like tetraheme cytochrome c subunit